MKDEQIVRILKDYDGGMRTSEICRKYNSSAETKLCVTRGFKTAIRGLEARPLNSRAVGFQLMKNCLAPMTAARSCTSVAIGTFQVAALGMSGMIAVAAILMVAALTATPQAHADEKVGTFSLDNVVLRPTYLSTEDQGGEFSLEDSQIGLSWRKDRHWSARFDLGDTSYRNLPTYYGQNETMYTGQTTPQFGLIDGYAEYDGVYGRVRAGIIPLDFGYEGNLDDAHRYFFYSQSIANRLVALDDEGVSFYTSHAGYFTELILHNGSVDQSNHGNVWLTGNWGYTNMQNFKWMMSLQTGYIPGTSTTNTTGVTVADFQPGVTARVRNGVIFAEYTPLYWDAVAEVGGGELVQNGATGRYEYQLAQVTHNISRNLAAGARYDFYNPNMGTSGLGQTELTALVMFKSDDGNSNLIFEGTKHLYESNQIHDDQLRVVWLVTPYAR